MTAQDRCDLNIKLKRVAEIANQRPEVLLPGTPPHAAWREAQRMRRELERALETKKAETISVEFRRLVWGPQEE